MYSGRFTAILDANVLYPSFLRDLLLSLAEVYLYRPKWSEEIEDEWLRNLHKNRADIPSSNLERTAILMNRAFPDAKVEGYNALIQSLTLPDPDDRHVLAAAILGKADVIVTSNLSDFPNEELIKFNIQAISPDEFVLNLIDLDGGKAKNALENMQARRKNPPVTIEELINMMENRELINSAAEFEKILGTDGGDISITFE